MDSEKSSVILDKPAKSLNTTDRRRFSLAKLLSSRSKTNDSKRKKSNKSNPLQMNDLKIVNVEAVIKIVLVGDGTCGKTRFIIVSSKGNIPATYTPTVLENYSIKRTIDGVSFHMRLWDTLGQEDYDRLRPLSYQNANVICICFSIGDPDSFENVKAKWAPEIEHFNKKIGAAKFLLGFRKEEGEAHGEGAGDARVQGVGREEAERFAMRMGAHKYLERELTKEGISDVLPTILGMILEESPGLRSRIFPSHG